MSDDEISREIARYVAQLIGFDLVAWDDLPSGFRHNWEDASRAGWFFGCDGVGSFKRAYCAYLCRSYG